MNTRRRFHALSLAALLALSASWASASPAEDFVKAKQAELSTLLKQGGSDAKIDKIFDQILDYGALAQGALQDHWAELKDPEKAEFKELLAKLVRNSYRKNLKKTLGYDVEYKGASQVDSKEVVRTVAKSKTNAREEPLSIDYVVQGGPERIVDIITEGSSMVKNYRMSFNRIIKKQGVAGLLKRMRDKAATSGTSGAVD